MPQTVAGIEVQRSTELRHIDAVYGVIHRATVMDHGHVNIELILKGIPPAIKRGVADEADYVRPGRRRQPQDRDQDVHKR